MTRTRCSAPRVSIEQLLRAVGGWRGSSGGGGRNRTGVDEARPAKSPGGAARFAVYSPVTASHSLQTKTATPKDGRLCAHVRPYAVRFFHCQL
jgi:hypothetical protein